MATKVDAAEKVSEHAPRAERGHDVWKRGKIERGLEQSRDRSAMIPVERILDDLSR